MTVAVLLVFASVAGAAGVSAVSGQSDAVDVHHNLRTDAHVQQYTDTGEVTNSAENTRVTVEDADGFIRVKAENPNGYAVDYTVDIPADIVSPAELGDVAAVNGADVEAEWYVRQDLSSGEHHTRVEVTVPAGENVTLAPSKPRIVTLAWTADAQETTDGLMDRFSGSSMLEQNEYKLQPPENGSSVSVSLTNPENSEEEIKEWHALYRVDNGTWYPVGTDAEDPVYQRENTGSNRVEFVYNNPDAEVKFTANPGFIDKTEYSVRTYTAGWGVVGDLIDSVPLTTGVPAAFPGGDAVW